jgi:glycerol-3-phosphate acyltransferase PlsY
MGDFRCIIMLRFRANILMIPMVITKRLLLPMILLAITMSVMMLTAIILNYKSDDNIERDGLWPC